MRFYIALIPVCANFQRGCISLSGLLAEHCNKWSGDGENKRGDSIKWQL